MVFRYTPINGEYILDGLIRVVAKMQNSTRKKAAKLYRLKKKQTAETATIIATNESNYNKKKKRAHTLNKSGQLRIGFHIKPNQIHKVWKQNNTM